MTNWWPAFAEVELRFHRRVQADLNEILGKYYDISHQLGEDFFAEFQVGVSRVTENPRRHHFDRSGLRRVCIPGLRSAVGEPRRWASMLLDRVKLQFLLPVMLTALAFGCSTPKSWGHAGTTHIAVSGPSGARVTGFYVQDGRKVAVSEAVPWTVSVPRLSSLEFRSTDSHDTVSADLRYDSLTAHAHTSSTLDSARGTRVEVRNGFVISTVR